MLRIGVGGTVQSDVVDHTKMIADEMEGFETLTSQHVAGTKLSD